MASRRKGKRQQEHPELEPYAPPEHPDVNVPEQQFEGERQERKQRPKSPPSDSPR